MVFSLLAQLDVNNYHLMSLLLLTLAAALAALET